MIKLCLIFIFSVIFHFFIFNTIKNGYMERTLQNKLVEKLLVNDFSWLNKLLILIFIFYSTYTLLLMNNIIYLDDVTINVEVQGIKFPFKGLYFDKLLEVLESPTVFLVGFKFGVSLMNKDYFSFIHEANNYRQFINQKSRIIELIEKEKGETLSQIFKNSDSTTELTSNTFFINSPIEPNERILIEYYDFFTTILQQDYILHFLMIYLIIMLIYLFTIKLILDKNISFEPIKNLPLGPILFKIITKFISIWKNSLYFWIYFILIFLLIFVSCSTYVLYVCTTILQG